MQIATDGATFDVCDEGSGPPVVLLQGYMFAKEAWEHQASALVRDARVVRLDLRGLGRSKVTPGPYLMETLAGDVASVLDALAVERAVIVAHSLASAVAFAFYRMFSERVAGLCLICGWADADDSAMAQLRFTLADAVERDGMSPLMDLYLPRCFAPHVLRDHPDLIERVRAMGFESDPRGVAATIRGFAMRSAADDLFPEIAVPVRIVAGAEDALIPLARQQAVAASIRGAVLDVLASGHLAPLEAPDAVTESIRQLVVTAIAGSTV
jgi:pimeloyl-ACP methyl ester carboxylesterase